MIFKLGISDIPSVSELYYPPIARQSSREKDLPFFVSFTLSSITHAFKIEMGIKTRCSFFAGNLGFSLFYNLGPVRGQIWFYSPLSKLCFPSTTSSPTHAEGYKDLRLIRRVWRRKCQSNSSICFDTGDGGVFRRGERPCHFLFI